MHSTGHNAAPSAVAGPARHTDQARPRAGSGGGVVLLLLGALLALVATIIVLLVRGGSGDVTATAAAGARAALAAEVARDRAQALFTQGDYDQALAVLAPGIAAEPHDQDLRLLMAQVQCGLKQYDEAYRHMEAAIAIGPPAHQIQFDAGTIASRAGLLDRALEHYSMAQQADPKEPRYPLYLGMIQIKLGEESAAMASLVRAVTLDPGLAEAWGTMGELELKNNTLGLAADHLAKAVALQPRAPRWRIGEARVLNRRGQPERAAELLTALEPTDRHRPEALALMGECFGLLNQPRRAAEEYAAAAAGPGRADIPELHYQAAVWFKRAGDDETARKHARRARDLGFERAKELLD